MTPKEMAERLIECLEDDDEMRYEANAMMFGHQLAQAYLQLESRIQKLEAVAEAAREYAEYTQRDSSLREALAALEQK